MYYYIRITVTNSDSIDYAVASVHESAESMELSVLAIDLKGIPEGEAKTFWGGVYVSSKTERDSYVVEFQPFHNSLPVGGEILQNCNDMEKLRQLLKSKKYAWISRPVEPKAAPPRWNDPVVFPLYYAKLPRRIEREEYESSIVKDEAVTDLTITFLSREL